MDVPYLIEENLWMYFWYRNTQKKLLVEVSPPQSWPSKQNGATIVAAVMILKVVINWRSVLQINILKKKC